MRGDEKAVGLRPNGVFAAEEVEEEDLGVGSRYVGEEEDDEERKRSYHKAWELGGGRRQSTRASAHLRHSEEVGRGGWRISGVIYGEVHRLFFLFARQGELEVGEPEQYIDFEGLQCVGAIQKIRHNISQLWYDVIPPQGHQSVIHRLLGCRLPSWTDLLLRGGRRGRRG